MGELLWCAVSRGPKRRLDEHEVSRLCDRLVAGDNPKKIGGDFGIVACTVYEYAKRAGLVRRWIYPGRQRMLPAIEPQGGISPCGAEADGLPLIATTAGRELSGKRA